MYGILAATGGPNFILHTVIAAVALVAALAIAFGRKIRRAFSRN